MAGEPLSLRSTCCDPHMLSVKRLTAKPYSLTTYLGLIRKISVSLLACWSLCATLQSAEDATWEVRVDYRIPEKKVPQFFASANINSVNRLFRESGDSDETIKRLGIRFMRFQMGG